MSETAKLQSATALLAAMSDEERPRLARSLLIGFLNEDQQGRRRTGYLSKGSCEELAARLVMAELLRSNSPLDRELRAHLADLFNPWSSQERKIEIVFKRRGGRRDYVRNTQIACHVYDKVAAGGNVAAGINSAVEKFGVSEELVKKIWGRYRRQLEQTDGRLPVRSRGRSKR
jgi:hypothetical protein